MESSEGSSSGMMMEQLTENILYKKVSFSERHLWIKNSYILIKLKTNKTYINIFECSIFLRNHQSQGGLH